MKRKRRRYTAEFKQEAVRLAARGDRPVSVIARELGLSYQLLQNWKNTIQKSSVSNGSGPVGHFSLEEENRKLKSELARVREERDFLKEATAFFAKESR